MKKHSASQPALDSAKEDEKCLWGINTDRKFWCRGGKAQNVSLQMVSIGSQPASQPLIQPGKLKDAELTGNHKDLTEECLWGINRYGLLPLFNDVEPVMNRRG